MRLRYVVLVAVALTLLLTSCIPASGVFIFQTQGEYVVYTNGTTTHTLAHGNLIYGETHGSTTTLIVSSISGTLKSINVNPISGRKTETPIFQAINMVTTSPYIENSPCGTWIIITLKNRHVALLLKDGKIVFNSEAYMPESNIPIPDSAVYKPISVAPDGSCWLMLKNEDYYLLHIGKKHDIENTLTIAGGNKRYVVFQTLLDNILIIYQTNDGEYGYKLVKPDGRVVIDTSDIANLKKLIPLYKTYKDSLAFVYQDFQNKLHVVVVKGDGTITVNRTFPLGTTDINNHTAILQWTDDGHLYFYHEGNLCNVNIGICQAIDDTVYTLLSSKNNIVAIGYKGIYITSEDMNIKKIKLTVSSYTPLKGEIILITASNHKAYRILGYDIQPLNITGTLLSDGIYTAPNGRDTLILSRSSKNYLLYLFDGTTAKLIEKSTSSINISTYPYIAWAKKEGNSVIYTSTNTEIVKENDTYHVDVKGISPNFIFVFNDQKAGPYNIILLIENDKVVYTLPIKRYDRVYPLQKGSVYESVFVYTQGGGILLSVKKK